MTDTPKAKSFYQRLVEAAKERIKKFPFVNVFQADAVARAVVNQEAKKLRMEAVLGSEMRNKVRRRRVKSRMERRSRQINFAKARA